MEKTLMPLHYAIIKHFEDKNAYCAADVMQALQPDYGTYKLFTLKDVEEALATAKENGLLDESRYTLDAQGGLCVYYVLNDFGAGMINRYL